MNTQKRLGWSRREAIGAAVCAALGLARSASAFSPPAPLPLITKAIPSSGERIPAIGLGSDAFRASERDAIRDEIKRMNQLGGTLIDTAAAYGDSEALIGDALASLGQRERMFIASKLTAAGGLFGSGLFGSGGGGKGRLKGL